MWLIVVFSETYKELLQFVHAYYNILNILTFWVIEVSGFKKLISNFWTSQTVLFEKIIYQIWRATSKYIHCLKSISRSILIDSLHLCAYLWETIYMHVTTSCNDLISSQKMHRMQSQLPKLISFLSLEDQTKQGYCQTKVLDCKWIDFATGLERWSTIS